MKLHLKFTLREYRLLTLDRQHRGAVAIPHSALLIPLSLFPHVRGRPQLTAILIILIVQVTLSQAVVCGVNCASVLGAGVGATLVGKVGAKNENVT